MKISESILRSKLKDYLQSDSFQKKYNEQVQPQRSYWYWTKASLNREILNCKIMILDAARALTERAYSGETRFGGTSPDGLLDHRITNISLHPTNPKLITSCKVELFFNPDWVKSASLYPEGYPEGVDNIIRLLTNGWDYRADVDQSPSAYAGGHRGTIKGDWHLGSPKSRNIIPNVRAVSYNRGSPILFDAVEKYNRKKANDAIYVTLSSKYVGAYGILRKNYAYNTLYNNAWLIEGIGLIRFGTKH